MKKEVIQIQYLDFQASNNTYHAWKGGVLSIDSEMLQIYEADKEVLNYPAQDIGSAKLTRLTGGGNPAWLTLSSVNGVELIALRPKRRYLRVLKQANEMVELAKVLNATTGRPIADISKIKSLRVFALITLTVCIALIAMSVYFAITS